MTIRVGINGFGRIGRNFTRAVLESGADIEIVAVNDLTDNDTLAHLLKYDSILGTLKEEVSAPVTRSPLQARRSRCSQSATPQIFLGAISVLTSLLSPQASSPMQLKAKAHLDGGAKKVVISAPGEE